MDQTNEQPLFSIKNIDAEAVITNLYVYFKGNCLGEEKREYTESKVPHEAVQWVEIKKRKKTKGNKVIIGILAVLVFITLIVAMGYKSSKEAAQNARDEYSSVDGYNNDRYGWKYSYDHNTNYWSYDEISARKRAFENEDRLRRSLSYSERNEEEAGRRVVYMIIIDIIAVSILLFILFRKKPYGSYALFNCEGTYFSIDIKDEQTAFSVISTFKDRRTIIA